MAINNETRIQKTDTIEQLRQKNNEVSLHVGDNGLIDARILDKTESITAAASQTLFTTSGLRFEVKPGETIDNNAHTESLNVGVVKVFNGATELTQALSGTNTFVAPNHVGTIALTGSPTLTQFAHENVEVYHAASAQTDLTHASVTFRAKVLSCDITNGIRLKNQSGTYSASTALRVHPGSSGRSVSTNTILSSQHTGLTAVDATFGSIIKLNTAASAGNVIKIVSTNLVDAINEVQDDVGNILELGSNNKSDIVTSINELETGLRGTRTGLVAADLSGMTADNVVSAILEHEVDIGNMTLTGLTATNLSAGIRELRTELGNHSSLVTSATGNVVAAVNEVHADALASVKLTSASTQTINSNTTYTTGNTILVPTGATLDIRQGNLLVGGGTGASLGFDTAFLNITSNTNQRGLSFERSNYSLGNDVELIFDQTMVAATKGHRAFRIKGLNESGAAISDSGNVNHVYQDLVTFYNAKDLITTNSETGIDVTWDSANGNFDFALTADPTISLGGDLSGSVALTNLATSTFTLTATIGAGTVENTMLAGSIAASKLAGSIGNSKLSNSTITISDGSNTSPVALGGTLTVQGTSSEVTVAESAGTVTVGLPNDVTIGNDLTVTGDLLVQGDTVTLNTSTLAVEDTLVLMGTAGGEPSTGGFGLETRAFTGTTAPHSNAAAGVTGTHSLVYNFATDQWEADGNQLLDTVNSLITPQIKTNNGASGHLTPTDLTGTRDLDFIQGSGITIAGALNSTDIDITITNSDKGSSQNIFKNVASTSGTAVADNNNDTLTIVGGNNLTTSVSADTLTIQHDNSGVSAASYGSQFVVPRITVDARGHLTSVVSQTAISLSALGYSGASNADNYGSFSIKANSGAAEAIGSGETITFTDSGATTVTRSGNVIDISSVNTQYSVGDGGLTQNNFTNADHSKLDGIAANANNYSFNINANGGTNENISNTEAVRFNGGGATSVVRSGNTITISSTDTNTNTDTVTRIKGQSGSPSLNSGDITFNGGGATSVSQSGNTITISSTDTNTDTNTQLTAAQVRANFSGGTNVSISSTGVISSTDTNTNTVTSNVAGNGISVSAATGSSTIAMTGSFTGTFTASADVVAFSDKKLKDNIQTLDGSKVFDMRGVSFNRNDQDGKLSSGVIAQELEHIAPELIHESEDGTKGVAYGNTVGYLIEAIKLLKAEIEELKIINKGIEK